MENYNTNKIKTLMTENGVLRADLKRALGISNEKTIIRYVNGEDIHVSRLLQIADFFGCSITEFFLSDGIPVAQSVKTLDGKIIKPLKSNGSNNHVFSLDSPSQTIRCNNDADVQVVLTAERRLHQQELEHYKKMSEMRIEYERKLAMLERDNVILEQQLQSLKNKKSDGNNSYTDDIIGIHPNAPIIYKKGIKTASGMAAEEHK